MAARGGTAKAKVAIPQLAWKAARAAPIVLISGPEDVLAERASTMLRDALRADDPSLEVSDLEADGYARGTLITLASPSLFGEPRLIRVSGVEKASDEFLADALDYLADPADGTTVVLRHRAGMRGKKLLDAIRAGEGGGVEIVCAELRKDSEKQDFAADEFRLARRRIAPAALRALVAAFSDDLGELAAACRQLIADVPGDVDEATVARYYGGRVETTSFEVADAAIAGRHGEALIALRHALDSGADPVPMVAAFAMKVRTMAKVAGARGAAAGALGLAPWQVDRARRDLMGWTDEGLGSAIQALAAADAAVKGAERDPVFALERLIGVIAARGIVDA
ncbi:DNA polymerase-3 subunit delta [Agromyces flavus]|uniref:DNA-directed DNA polymerase n=1 Tax=Agromyces flavus TaxID=589382 RepID=A0A1H1S4L1_9MICO|nr:DNA polymerase III subunit delta [Agromyces flavus]MCP2368947.1 DNA polymerase-3 subunit delta [Agromyces flavus]GGI48404.1 DNA polymerase III subunit delta [Agromyces flavus]SDS42965.1 DNA polymerase III, delta subunit [Agromyces flavus]